MTRRYIHYEAAFEDYLRSEGLAYIAVDEHRKAIFNGGRIKSFDFIVYRAQGPNWLVDVKGRKFPYEHDGRRRYWENWITREDLDALTSWEQAFGDGFQAVFVFAYVLLAPGDRQPTAHVHPFQGSEYAFMCVSLEEYRQGCRLRSPKWDTLSLSAAEFRRQATPIQLA